MGTSNFGRTNVPSGIVYAFAMGWGDGHTEEAYEETIQLVHEKLMLSDYVNEEWLDKSRKIIGYVNVTLFNKDSKQWECGSINVLVEHGYHEGARLDIDLDDLYDNFPPLNKSQQKTIDNEVRRIEKAFAKVTHIKLKRVGGFSDGTSLYEAV